MKIQHGYLYLPDLNPQAGSEPGKTRPVLVIQNDLLNEVQHPSTWILPATTQIKTENLLRAFIPKHLAGNDRDCDIMIDQSRAIDNQRFKTQLGPVPDAIMKEVKAKLKLLADL